MSEMKSFSRVNGWMLFIVFGLCSVVALLPDLWTPPTGQLGFARLIRAEDKSYFGFHHYYFTILTKTDGEEVRSVLPVDSNLFHRRKVGDNMEVIIHSPRHLSIASNSSVERRHAAFVLSILLAAVGVVFLLIAIRTGTSGE